MPAVTDTVISGPYLLAALLALARRRGVVRLAVRDPAGPRLPVLPRRAGRRGGRRRRAQCRQARPGRVSTARAPRCRPIRCQPEPVGPVGGSVWPCAAGPCWPRRCSWLGFTVVFVAQSVAVVGLSRALLANNETLMRVGGAVTVVMGLVMLGLIRPLQTERRLHVRPTGRILGAPLLGAVFAFGWTVCLGPTLVGVLSLANATDWGGSAWRGLSLVIFYCAGLGIPFLLLAFGFGWATGAMGFLRRHTRTIQLIGAISLIVLGPADADRAVGHVHRLAAGPDRRRRDGAVGDRPRQHASRPTPICRSTRTRSAGGPAAAATAAGLRRPAAGRRPQHLAAADQHAGRADPAVPAGVGVAARGAAAAVVAELGEDRAVPAGLPDPRARSWIGSASSRSSPRPGTRRSTWPCSCR